MRAAAAIGSMSRSMRAAVRAMPSSTALRSSGSEVATWKSSSSFVR